MYKLRRLRAVPLSKGRPDDLQVYYVNSATCYVRVTELPTGFMAEAGMDPTFADCWPKRIHDVNDDGRIVWKAPEGLATELTLPSLQACVDLAERLRRRILAEEIERTPV